MALRDELTEEEGFTTEPGTRTLTVESDLGQIMIPWINFRHALWSDENIQIHFHGWRVDLIGSNLTELWGEIQQQRVVSLRQSSETETVACFIRSVNIVKVKKKQRGK